MGADAIFIVGAVVWLGCAAVIFGIFWRMAHEELPPLSQGIVEGRLTPRSGNLAVSTQNVPFTREMVAERALEAELEKELVDAQEYVWALHNIDAALVDYEAEDPDMWPQKGPGWTGQAGL